MTTDTFLYRYPSLTSGILKKRYKRFLADIELETGELITAHCANTGPMLGLCAVGSHVMVSKSDNPKRKLAYTWEMIAVGENNPIWVGINTALPNRIIKIALQQQLIPELASQYTQVKSEVKFGHDGKSRIDFVLTGDEFQPPIYVEVKNTTLAENEVALFPDTETLRGQKHLQELMALPQDVKPVMLYFINREDCETFAVGKQYDATYGDLFNEAMNQRVKILPCRFQVSPEGVKYLGVAKII
ncbi:sugar/maltose fermentation stimulation protein homolog [Geminocystis sp. NIES-3708]|uniref:DNA/RNA nuclease SfsA n=1 Tax=Geminocystis sp. NIES-3708 TaxID=1615909 RepID=UPI0005FC55A8|nr:DNA/RNA nuclease SfsA [Geminocystis sp. NIES-3708]BAQ61449.1 sugar/maltose fermentation stimulation protein homolog [Geminocystis sp. NIES-3708]